MKKAKKIILFLIAILLVLCVLTRISFAYTYTNTDRDKVLHRADGKGNTTSINDAITNNKKIRLVMPAGGGNTGTSDGVTWISALQQPHVYCAQHGSKLGNAEFTVSQKYTVEDPILAYIFNHGPAMGSFEADYSTEASQIALWYYLDNNNTKDKTNILGTLTQSVGHGDKKEEHSCCTAYKTKNNLYKEAETYKTNISENVTPSLTLSLNGNTLNINVGGNFTNFTLIINGVEHAKTKAAGTAYSENIDVSSYTTSEVSVKVKVNKTSYTAEYAILSNANQQRVLVVTNVGSTNSVVESEVKTVQINTNVSLQKYITKVNDNNVTSRADQKTVAGDDAKVKDSIAKNISAKNTYKRSAPVMIEAGDTVTYRVHVYNNSNINATSVLIKDCLPYYNDSNGNAQSYVSIESIKKDGTTDVTWNLEDSKLYGNKNTYYYTLSNLAGGASTYFDITVRFNKFCDYVIANTAWISTTSPTNKADYRTVDRDYIQMRTDYKVSLEKFVTEVADGEGRNIVEYTNDKDRSGKRYNEYAENTKNIENYNVHKYNNRVEVEPGDLVTFTIRLKNTGASGAPDVKVSKIYDVFTFFEEGKYNGLKLEYDSTYGIQGNGGGTIENKHYQEQENSDKRCDRYLIKFENPITLKAGEHTDLTIRFKVNIDNGLTTNILPAQEDRKDKYNDFYNKAVIVEIKNKNSIVVPDGDGTDNNADMDFLVNKLYKVSLQKIVYSVNNNTEGITSFNRWRSWESNEKKDKEKHNNPVTVANGDTVTYAIKVKNDGTTIVKDIKVKDTIPDGLDLNSLEIVKITDSNNKEISNAYKDFNKSNKEVSFTLNTTLNPNESNTIYMSIKVTESNMSINVLKNYAEIIGTMLNRNGCDVLDSTADNNQDADYIQLKDIIISGTVWNDKALDKAQVDYNGIYNYQDNKENALAGINVELHRVGKGLVAKTTTNNEGKYLFSAENLINVTNNTRYIKAAKNANNIRWNDSKEYYSYYVTFEYDGITYTSTKFTEITSDNAYDSNAKEDNGIIPSGTRKAFNDKFSTINNNSNIEYNTVNEEGYIPQSVHKYDSKTMSIKSSTSKIDMSHTPELEEQLMHVNLGLRGRDIFDLDIKTDVYSTKVTVNGVEGEYQYNNNKVTLRKADISVVEDAANFANESIESTVSSVNQGIRKADIKNDAYDVDKDGTKGDTGLKIEVTYKITVKNVSKTDGAVTKVTDYYDAKYNFIKAYIGDYEMTIANKKAVNGSTGNGYKSVTLTTNGTNITQNDSVEIYLVFELINPSDTLSALTQAGEQKLPTFNIAEITEYTTKCGEGQTEYTRGLLDKDSAPGRINKEQVRLTTTVGQNTVTENGNPTTLKYYFDGAMEYVTDRTSNKLNFLKYEDDTYAAPILYFVSPADPDGGNGNAPDYRRTVTGIVFEDKTTTDPTTKVKTGDGILGEGEVGIFGATVELVEINTNKSPKEIKENEGVVRFTTTTGKDGRFVIQDFLPGNYVIRYRYGNKTETVLLHQSGEVNINGQSYNGEDYQSTNNTGNYIENKLNETSNYWYIFNEKGISTATDNENRRLDVSDNVIIFTDEEMTVLNNMRAGKSEADAKVTYQENGQNKEVTVQNVINSTKMYATTPKMFFTVEQTINLDKLGDDKSTLIEKKLIVDKGNNLGEWAKFPNKDDNYYKEYKIENMNFGIAEVPVTTIDLGKTIQSFTITDSTGSNVIVSVSKKEDGSWTTRGNVIPYPGEFDVSIEDDKLQGARLQVTYTITSKIWTEKNFDNKSLTVPTIEELVDYIDNNLSYNENLGENKKYWEITTLEEVKDDYKAMTYNNGTIPQGTADREGKKYTTIVRAKDDNPILLTQEGTGTATITLEKILSSTDSTFEEIITSTVDTFVYNNIIEITKLDYENYNPESDPEDTPPGDDAGSDPEDTPPDDVLRDRVRTPDRYIILPGVQHDTAISETITIHPPTGDSSINIIYYVMAVISLVILIAGVFGIKRFVIKK